MTADPRPVIDFDHHSEAYARNWEQAVRDLHALDYPLAWSEANGGYWVLGSWSGVDQVARDWETFSADNDLNGERRGGKGSRIPQDSYQLKLSESDPPFHTARRQIELPFVLPKALRGHMPMIERFVDEAIDSVQGRETADLLWDVVLPVSARTTLNLVGFGEGWADVARSVHLMSYMKPTDPDFPHDQVLAMQEGFRAMIAERRANPQPDIASALASGVVLGEPLSDADAESMMTALVFGGFDTTTTAAIDALVWLQDRPEERARLLADQDLLTNAIDEWLRMWPPAQGIARTVMRDVELGGRQLRTGERLYMWLPGANRDPAKFPDPETVQLDRKNARDQLAFSGGNHRCLGAQVAKFELRLLLQAILTRMPDYRIDLAATTRFPTYSAVAGYLDVPMAPGTVHPKVAA